MSLSHPLVGDAKYVPYTPRQRPASAPARPQLRAAAQNIGLEASSAGCAILDRICDASDDWHDVWNALTKAKATLLLPSEPASDLIITPEYVQDHVALIASGNVVTLSGLRGHIAADTLTFRSTLHRSAKSFQSVWSRTASLDALPPLPAFPPESSYPSFAVSASTATLALPARATKPPLPPRPGGRGPSAPSSARLSMPFASLFGQRPSTPPPPSATTPTTTAPSPPDPDATIDISALVIDTAISRTDVATSIISAIKGEIAIALNDHPPWLVERVHAFATPYLPFVRTSAKKKLQDIGGNRLVYAVTAQEKPDEVVEKFQAFYRSIEAELRRGGGGGGGDEGEGTDEAEEARIRGALETVESTLCTLLYDRLFLPSFSDDASHNEALSSRIAALNMLDLSLEHLDVAIGQANQSQVDAIVYACGQTLAQLDLSARSPREKAAVLVSAHKLVVDGLSKIPPVRLKSRDDDKPVPTETPLDIPLLEPTDRTSPSMPTLLLSTSPDRPRAVQSPPAPEPEPTSSPVSGDVLLPILIFSVVKANPARLVSHLLYTQRFRNQTFGGEESYCLINLMAVAEFLENVDLGALGLGESEEKVISTADLTPIPIAAAALPSEANAASLRGRVEQGVDAIAGSANKVILGVVDSSFGVLRALLPGQAARGTSGLQAPSSGSGVSPASGLATVATTATTASATTITTAAASTATGGDSDLWGVRSLGLLRRDAGFSIAGLTAALPGGQSRRSQNSVNAEEEGQREMVEVVSRPGSLRSRMSTGDVEERDGDGGASTSDESEDEDEDEDEDGEGEGEGGAETQVGIEEDENGEEEGDGDRDGEEEVHDTRSIKSFESMLNSGRTKRTGVTAAPARRRKRLSDLTDRLTHGMAGMSRRVQGGSGSGSGSGAVAVTLAGRLPPPNRRFVECTEQDIRVSEVGELLREYQRLVEAVRSLGGFQE